MHRTRIPSPARSESSVTPRRKTRSTRSVGSPARSNASGRLTSIVDQFKEANWECFAASPLNKTVLTDNTEIEKPRRESWWKKVNHSKNISDVLEVEKIMEPNILDDLEMEVLSQERKNYSLDLPESSGSESVSSIVIPQRKLFTQKENVPQDIFKQILVSRKSINKTNVEDKTVNIGTKTLFGRGAKRSRPEFPDALLNFSPEKTLANQTKDPATEAKTQPRSLFSNRQGTKRKNMFADFIVSESEDEVSEIQPKLFAFQRNTNPVRHSTASRPSRGNREPSPASSLTTDIEMDDWKMLPSSTMVEHQLDALAASTPEKKTRLSKLSEAKESETGTISNNTINKTKLSNKSTSKNKSKTAPDKSPKKPELDKPSASKRTESNSDENIDKIETTTIEKNSSANKSEANSSKLNNTNHKTVIEHEDVIGANGTTNKIYNQTHVLNKTENRNLPVIDEKSREVTDIPSEVNSRIINNQTYKINNETAKADVILDNNDDQNIPCNSQLVEKEKIENVKEPQLNDSEAQVEAEKDVQDEKHIENEEEQIENNEEDARLVYDEEEAEVEDEREIQSEEEVQVEDEKESQVENDQSQVQDEKYVQVEDENEVSDENEEEIHVELDEEVEVDNEEKIQVEEVPVEDDDEIQVEDDEEVQVEDNEEAQVEDDEEIQVDDDEEVQIEEDEEFQVEDDEEVQVQDDEEAQVEDDEEVQVEDGEEFQVENDQEDDEVDVEDNEESQNEIEMEVENEEEPLQTESDVEKEEEEDQNENDKYVDEDIEQDIEIEEDQENVQVEFQESDQEVTGEIKSAQENENTHADVQVSEQEETGEINATQEAEATTPNVTHDTTGRHRQKDFQSPEDILHNRPNQGVSFIAKGRNTSIRKTLLKNFTVRQSEAPLSESTGLNDGTNNSSAEGSGWDSHRTTRKTLRQTFGKDFTPRKSLRALVMEKSAKRQTAINEANAKLHQANSTEIPDMEFDHHEMIEESDHEISKRTRQTTLEMYLQKVKNDIKETKRKIEAEVKNSIKTNPVKLNLQNHAPHKGFRKANMKLIEPKPQKAKRTRANIVPLEHLPEDFINDLKYKPPKRFRPSNASWLTKRLYKFLETKLEPKYDYKARLRAEKLAEKIYEFTRQVRKQRVAPPHAVAELKHEMARLDVVKTHYEFYDFIRDYLPYEVKIKVVPDILNNIPLPSDGLFSSIIA